MENQIMQVAGVQLIYKSKVEASLRPKITKAQDAFVVLKEHWNYVTIEFIEEFKMLLVKVPLR